MNKTTQQLGQEFIEATQSFLQIILKETFFGIYFTKFIIWIEKINKRHKGK